MRSRFTSRIRSRFRSSVSNDVGAFRSSSASPPVPGIAAPTLTITGGTTDTSLTPELNGSAYTQVGGNAESHASTDWQISDASDFSNIVWEADDSASLTQITVSLDLEDNTTYYARVRYNSTSYVSDWSAGVEFNTVNIFVTTPSITSPSDAATDIGETPTITSSAFAVTGGSDTHASSDWQIASDSGFSTIVVQSLDDASNLESWDVPSGNLSTSTTYYVRVRHTGTDEGDSAWSAGVSFTTASAFTDADAQAVIDAMTTAPTAGRQTLINNFVTGLKSDGIWSKLDRLFVFAAHTEQAGLLDWINPTGTAATATASPTFTVDEGFAGNGTTSYVNTNYTPSTDATNYALNSACMGVYVTTPPTANAFQTLIGGFASISERSEIIEFASGLITGYGPNANTGTDLSPGVASAAGDVIAIDRDGASSVNLYINGSSSNTSSVSSSSVPTVDIFVLARSESGGPDTFSTAEIGMAFIGASLSSAEHAAFKSRIDTYMAGL